MTYADDTQIRTKLRACKDEARAHTCGVTSCVSAISHFCSHPFSSPPSFSPSLFGRYASSGRRGRREASGDDHVALGSRERDGACGRVDPRRAGKWSRRLGGFSYGRKPRQETRVSRSRREISQQSRARRRRGSPSGRRPRKRVKWR